MAETEEDYQDSFLDEESDLDDEERLLQRIILSNFMARKKVNHLADLHYQAVSELEADSDTFSSKLWHYSRRTTSQRQSSRHQIGSQTRSANLRITN